MAAPRRRPCLTAPGGRRSAIPWPVMDPPPTPHRPVADRVLPRRRGAHGAVQLGAGPPARRARSCCASRTPTRPATGRSGRRGSSTRSPGSASAPTTRRSRGRTSRAPTPPPTSPRPQRLFDAGHAYYCDLTGEQIQERAKASGKPGYDGYSRDRGLGPGPAGCCASACPTGTTVVRRPRPRRGHVRPRDASRTSCCCAATARPMFLLANVVDDIEMGITHVVRGEEHLPEHAQAAAAVGGARPRAAGVGARAGARQRAAQEAVEAARQGGARAVPRRGLPRRRRWSTT